MKVSWLVYNESARAMLDLQACLSFGGAIPLPDRPVSPREPYSLLVNKVYDSRVEDVHLAIKNYEALHGSLVPSSKPKKSAKGKERATDVVASEVEPSGPSIDDEMKRNVMLSTNTHGFVDIPTFDRWYKTINKTAWQQMVDSLADIENAGESFWKSAKLKDVAHWKLIDPNHPAMKFPAFQLLIRTHQSVPQMKAHGQHKMLRYLVPALLVEPFVWKCYRPQLLESNLGAWTMRRSLTAILDPHSIPRLNKILPLDGENARRVDELLGLMSRGKKVLWLWPDEIDLPPQPNGRFMDQDRYMDTLARNSIMDQERKKAQKVLESLMNSSATSAWDVVNNRVMPQSVASDVAVAIFLLDRVCMHSTEFAV